MDEDRGRIVKQNSSSIFEESCKKRREDKRCVGGCFFFFSFMCVRTETDKFCFVTFVEKSQLFHCIKAGYCGKLQSFPYFRILFHNTLHMYHCRLYCKCTKERYLKSLYTGWYCRKLDRYGNDIIKERIPCTGQRVGGHL